MSTYRDKRIRKFGREEVLREIRALAPHEVDCTCLSKSIADIDAHLPECPRGQVAAVLKGVERLEQDRTSLTPPRQKRRTSEPERD